MILRHTFSVETPPVVWNHRKGAMAKSTVGIIPMKLIVLRVRHILGHIILKQLIFVSFSLSFQRTSMP